MGNHDNFVIFIPQLREPLWPVFAQFLRNNYQIVLDQVTCRLHYWMTQWAGLWLSFYLTLCLMRLFLKSSHLADETMCGILTFNEYCSWSFCQYVTSIIHFWCIHDTCMIHLFEAWTKTTLERVERNVPFTPNELVRCHVFCRFCEYSSLISCISNWMLFNMQE